MGMHDGTLSAFMYSSKISLKMLKSEVIDTQRGSVIRLDSTEVPLFCFCSDTK